MSTRSICVTQKFLFLFLRAPGKSATSRETRWGLDMAPWQRGPVGDYGRPETTRNPQIGREPNGETVPARDQDQQFELVPEKDRGPMPCGFSAQGALPPGAISNLDQHRRLPTTKLGCQRYASQLRYPFLGMAGMNEQYNESTYGNRIAEVYNGRFAPAPAEVPHRSFQRGTARAIFIQRAHAAPTVHTGKIHTRLQFPHETAAGIPLMGSDPSDPNSPTGSDRSDPELR